MSKKHKTTNGSARPPTRRSEPLEQKADDGAAVWELLASAWNSDEPIPAADAKLVEALAEVALAALFGDSEGGE